MAADGVDVATRQRILGHSTPYLTQQVYTHPYDEQLIAAADAMDRVLYLSDAKRGQRKRRRRAV